HIADNLVEGNLQRHQSLHRDAEFAGELVQGVAHGTNFRKIVVNPKVDRPDHAPAQAIGRSAAAVTGCQRSASAVTSSALGAVPVKASTASLIARTISSGSAALASRSSWLSRSIEKRSPLSFSASNTPSEQTNSASPG